MNKKRLLYLFVILTSLTNIHGQNLSDFDKITYPIISDSVLSITGNIPNSVKVVGLGESSHYTKEYYQYKNRIINNLLADRNFEAVIFEVDYGTALTWDKYVTNGVGDIDSILTDCPWWTYQTSEFKNVLEDIRMSNLDKTRKVRIFGMEMTYIPGAVAFIEEVYSQHFEGSNKEVILSKLQYVQDSIDLLAFSYHNSTEINSLLELNDLLYSSMDEFTEQDVSLVDLRIANNMLNQFVTYISNRNQFTQLKLRDQFSYTNIQWFTQMNDIEKFIIWAHSGHVQNKYNYPQLGLYLKEEYGNQYHSIGFDYGTGENGSRTPNQKLEGLSFELDLNSASFYLFNNYDSDIYVNLLEARNKSLLEAPIKLRNTLSEYTDIKNFDPNRNVVLPEINDGLIFIRNTSLPTKIPDWKSSEH